VISAIDAARFAFAFARRRGARERILLSFSVMSPGRSVPRRGVGVLLVTLALGATSAAACGDSAGPAGTGDTVVNDTRDAEPRAPADPSDGAPPTGEPDAAGSASPDASSPDVYLPPQVDGGAYPGASACSGCSCPATTAYCFGGATPRNDPMAIRPQGAVDAGPACPLVAAGSLGCTALPAGLTDCASLINSLQTTYACYLDCTNDGTQLTVFCASQ